MGIINKFMHTVFLTTDDELDEELEEKQEMSTPQKKEQPNPAREREGSEAGAKLFRDKRGLQGSKTIPMPRDDKKVGATIFYPTSFDDSPNIADCLRSNKMVIINFEKTDNLLAKRMTDFISGTIYALGGNMKKIGHKILLCAPKNIDIDSEVNIYKTRGDEPWKK